MINSQPQENKASPMSNIDQYLQYPIPILLDMFPKPPTHIPKPGSVKLEGRRTSLISTASKKGRMGSVIRTSWASQDTVGIKKSSPSLLKEKLGSITSSNSMLSPISNSNEIQGVAKSPSSNSGFLSNTNLAVDQDPDRFKYTLPAGLPEKDYLDILKRASKGVIAPKEQEALFKFLLALPPSKVVQLQKGTHEVLNDKNQSLKGTRTSIAAITETFGKNSSSGNVIDVSKYNLDFNLKGRNLKINEEAFDSVIMEAKGNKSFKYNFILPDFHPGYEIKIEPNQGKFKSKEKHEEIKFSLIIKRPFAVSEVIIMELEGGYRHFFTVKISSEWSNFGSTLEELEVIEVEVFPQLKRKIPRVLTLLRDLLIERDGLEVEEIFRKQVDEEKMMIARGQFDKKQFPDEMTPEIISNLIKIWFRELPVRIFDVDSAIVLSCDTEDKASSLVESLPENRKEIGLWFLDFMVEILSKKEKNRMTSKKLSIVLAPNLFQVNFGGNTNAEYLRKQADILTMLIDTHYKKIIKG